MQRFSSTAERAGLSRTAQISSISSRTGVVRLISMGLGAQGIRISSAYRSADRAMPGVVLQLWRVDDHHVISMGDLGHPAVQFAGRAEPRCGTGTPPPTALAVGSVYARSDHSRALPEGSASTRSTLCPACAKTWASQTADVVLPVPGLRLARATLSPVTWALSQRLTLFGTRAANVGTRCTGENCGLTQRDVSSEWW